MLDSAAPVTVLRLGKVHGPWAVKPREWVFVKRVLDRLPAVFLARRGAGVAQTVAADNVAALGLIATTNPGGADHWQPELAQWFAGKELAYILEDNDEPGRKHTNKIVAALRGIVLELGRACLQNRLGTVLADPHIGQMFQMIPRGTAFSLWQTTRSRRDRPMSPMWETAP